MEKWQSISAYNNIYSYSYEVSNLGNFRNTKTGNILKPVKSKQGYWRISLTDKTGKRKSRMAHVIVATEFCLNPMQKPRVNHIWGDKDDLRADNLEWCTDSENARHAYDTGLKKRMIGSLHFKARKVLNKVTNEVYESITEAAIKNNIGKGALIYWLNNPAANKSQLIAI